MNIQNKYDCTVHAPTEAPAGQALRLHLPGGSTFLLEMTSRLPAWQCDIKSKIRLRQLFFWRVFTSSTIRPSFSL